MKLLIITFLVHSLIVRFGDARPQVSEVQTTSTNAVNAAAQARDKAVSAANAANNLLVESGSQAGTGDYIMGEALAKIAGAAAYAAAVAAKATTGDKNAMSQLSNAYRQIQIQTGLVGSTIEELMRSTLGRGTDSGLLSGGQLPFMESIMDTLSNGGPLIESVRSVLGTAGSATTAANEASAAIQARTIAEARPKAAMAQKAASEAENFVRQAESTAASTDTIPGMEITSKMMLMVTNALAQTTKAVAEVANSVVERLSRVGVPSGSGTVNENKPNLVGGFLSPLFG